MLNHFIVCNVCFFLGLSSLFSQGTQFAWAKGFGDVGNDAGNVILADPNGQFYLGGFYRGNVDFDKGIVPHILKSKGSEDIFINKYDQNGQLIWALGYGGKGPDRCTDAVLDHSGDLIVIGNFRDSVDFGIFPKQSSGFNDVFIAKISPEGNLRWIRQLGGNLDENGRSVAVQKDGHIILTGTFQGKIHFDNSPIPELTAVKNTDIFIANVRPNGDLEWIKQIGGISEEIAYSVTTNAMDDIVLTGTYNSDVDFDPDSSEFRLLQNGVYPNMFVLGLTAEGHFRWAKQFSGENNLIPYHVKCDHKGKIILTGTFRSKVDFDPGLDVHELISPGNLGDAFVLKLQPDGSLDWVKQLGGNLNEIGLGLFIDTEDNIYSTGCYEDLADFDPGPKTYILHTDGIATNNDIYVSKLTSMGDFIWARSIQGAQEDIGFSICVDPSHTVYSTGIFSGLVKVNPGADSSFLMSQGLTDIFIHSIRQIPVSTADSDLRNTLKIYPNPCRDFFILKGSSDLANLPSFQIIDKFGKKINGSYSLNLNSNDAFFLEVHLPVEIPNGEYFMEMTQRNVIMSKSFLICR